MPKLELVVSTHQEHGVLFAVNSIPYNAELHFNMSSPVTSGRAMEMLRGYLQAVGQGKRYTGARE